MLLTTLQHRSPEEYSSCLYWYYYCCKTGAMLLYVNGVHKHTLPIIERCALLRNETTVVHRCGDKY